MQVSFAKGLMAGAAGAAVVLAITAAANGTGIGAVFNLGRTNKVNATSTLTGKPHGNTRCLYPWKTAHAGNDLFKESGSFECIAVPRLGQV